MRTKLFKISWDESEECYGLDTFKLWRMIKECSIGIWNITVEETSEPKDNAKSQPSEFCECNEIKVKTTQGTDSWTGDNKSVVHDQCDKPLKPTKRIEKLALRDPLYGYIHEIFVNKINELVDAVNEVMK